MGKRKKRKKSSRGGFRALVWVFLFAAFVSFVLYGVWQVLQYKGADTSIAMPKGNVLHLQEHRVVEKGSENRSVATPKRGIRHPYKNLEVPRNVSTQKRKEQLIEHTGYTVSYNADWRIPNWVGYELLRSELEGGVKRSDNFMPDPQVKKKSAENSDYRRSGFDRGHMAPAGDMTWDKQAMQESFYFSNICPQNPSLNSGAWRLLEEQIRLWAKKDSAVVVVCGPIVNPSRKMKKIGKNGVVVPSFFFKVVLVPYGDRPKGIGFLFKNSDTSKPFREFAVSIDSVESVTGLDFFAPLPDTVELRVEASFSLDDWSWRR